MLKCRCEHCGVDFEAMPDGTGYEQAPCPSCGYLCMTLEFLEQERQRHGLTLPWLTVPQFTLRTLLLAVTLLAVFLGMSLATRSYFCSVVVDGYVYGFPFPAIATTRYSGDIFLSSVNANALLGDAIVFVLVLLGVSRAIDWLATRKSAGAPVTPGT